MEIKLVKPIGYCSGVIKAIELAKKIRCDYKNNDIYIFGMLVHNDTVINKLNECGIKTVSIELGHEIEQLNRFKRDDIVIFTAHGHPKYYEDILNENHVMFFDSTCPKVKYNLDLISDSLNDVIYVGKKNHPEAIASLSLKNENKNIVLYDMKEGLVDNTININNPLVINQTTLSIVDLDNIHKDIKRLFPNAIFTNEVCSSTRLRQQNLKSIDNDTDLIIVVGGNNSSNTNELFSLAKLYNKDKLVIKVSRVNELEKENIDFNNISKVAIASGTSTPLDDIKEIEEYLRKW